jgi:hypothetical protein
MSRRLPFEVEEALQLLAERWSRDLDLHMRSDGEPDAKIDLYASVLERTVAQVREELNKKHAERERLTQSLHPKIGAALERIKG